MTRRSWTWDFGPLTEIEVAINDLLEEIADVGGACRLTSFPETELRNTASGYEVVAAVPGLARDEIEVAVQGQSIKLSGTRTRAQIEGASPVRAERAMGAFEKSVPLPDDADLGRIRARLTDGLLSIEVPFRSDEVKRVEIEMEDL